MKSQRAFPSAVVSAKAEASLKNGHPWVYDEEINEISAEIENGGLVDVLSLKGSYMGTGLWSEKSKIRIRVLDNNANESFDEKFFYRRVKYAVDYRLQVMGPEDFRCCRLIFGEADGLPGLTVDRFSDILVAQILSYGIDQRREMILGALWSILENMGEKISGIYLRNDVGLRTKEGLEEGKGWLELPGRGHPEQTVTEITENKIRYSVDFENGQKTGFFLDQKYNRKAVAKIAGGKRVLDCFTHTGSFALNAAMGGAEHVTAVDVSASAVEMARSNAAANGLEDRMDFVCADVFDLLPKLKEEHAAYDFIILDPPAFTKSRRTVDSAERGYREINRRALQLLPRGGYLATASCSHFMADELFVKMLKNAAKDAGVKLRQIEARQQGPDHPILWNVPETDYLKFYIFQVV